MKLDAVADTDRHESSSRWVYPSMGPSEELKWRKNICLKYINADDGWRGKKSESVTL